MYIAKIEFYKNKQNMDELEKDSVMMSTADPWLPAPGASSGMPSEDVIVSTLLLLVGLLLLVQVEVKKRIMLCPQKQGETMKQQHELMKLLVECHRSPPSKTNTTIQWKSA